MSKLKLEVSEKSVRVQVRMRSAEKAVLAQAAGLQDTTLGKFILESSVLAARRVLADQVHFTLAEQDWDRFCRALDEKPRVIPAVKRLLLERSVFENPGDVSSK